MARVLLIENDALAASLIEHRLLREGEDVAIESQGTTALERLQETEFDLVVLSADLDDVKGAEMLRRLQGVIDFNAVPVIVLAQSDNEAFTARALDLGAWDCIHKPFSPVVLAARLRRVLNQRSFLTALLKQS
jgi:DNA-binding response OmpR family regulator